MVLSPWLGSLSGKIELQLAKLKLRLYLLLTHGHFKGWERRVLFFRFGIPLVLKRTDQVFCTEADALRFLNRAVPHLPIPKLIDSFELDGATYTLMTKLPGRPLLEIPTLESDQLAPIINDVLYILEELWRIPQPASFNGRVMASASGDGLLHPVGGYEDFGGPYASTLDLYKEDPIVWVHTDLRMQNMLIEKGRVTGIVDWEWTGWLPRHWQLHILRRPGPFCVGAWVRYWLFEHHFDDTIEAAYTASTTEGVLTWPI
ncbi:unnamed protein product [Somion occarium]|uniref:Aminoglycoside phosphotransferase domain-containing protein n=1 Tax=Somion occarium TaxID=3059160 RepID=A0ABP1E9T4_9APHY